MDIDADDLRIDIIRVAGRKPCAIRVTHVPTGVTAAVDDRESTEANREAALTMLQERLTENL